MIQSEVHEAISRLSANKCYLVGVGLVRRLAPGFDFFAKKHAQLERGEDFLRALSRIQSTYDVALSKQGVFGEVASVIAHLTPDTNDYDDLSASYALDAASSAWLLATCLGSPMHEKVLQISVLSIDSADRVIQELERIDFFDKNIEKLIQNHKIMLKELMAQAKIIEIASGNHSEEIILSEIIGYADSNLGSVALRQMD
ncbi:DUF416 family protein [Aquabacterium soli]|uniref:DUF416 family protein n=1 Tax=Aquabacterium soli TaxID=2493092 RepID=A0A426VH33_9BURK|nr:DUF416 family protein [Aquabacterium soli]RRS06041.1 DUF416 family protein [Aquabacterium soli]